MWTHSLRSTKSTTRAEAMGGSAPDPVIVDQHAVLAAVKPTPRQRERIIGVQSQKILAHLST